MTTQEHYHVGDRDNYSGYKSFEAGSFGFTRDEYFAHITWPKGSHIMAIDAFLRALMRDVAWGFFDGTVNFDAVFRDHQPLRHRRDVCGHLQRNLQERRVRHPRDVSLRRALEDFQRDGLGLDERRLRSVRRTGRDRGAVGKKEWKQRRCRGPSPSDGQAHGRRCRRCSAALGRKRLPGQPHVRGTFLKTSPSSRPSPASRTKSPLSISTRTCPAPMSLGTHPCARSCTKVSFAPPRKSSSCPSSTGNDRVEWFVQLSDAIIWDVKDKETGRARAKVTMRAGDVAAMPADIRHQGYAPKRSMLLVWENASLKIPELIQKGEAPVVPVKF